jgi:uncharacterized protein (TIGR03435 family)
MRTHARIRSRRTSHYPIVGLALAGAILNGMTSQARADATRQAINSPAFEVASVKPNRSGTTQANAGLQPNGVNLINLPLRGIIQIAYGIQQPAKLVGVPDWTITERFDIVGRTAGNASGDEIRLMLQSLLVDRFKLVARRDTRPLDAYALVLARKDGRLGDHLRPSTSNCTPPPTVAGAGARSNGGQPTTAPASADMCGPRTGGAGRLILEGSPIAQFTSLLALTAGRAIVNKTGLTGRYDIDLTYVPERPGPGFATDNAPAANDPNAPSLFTALQEQLGLKLERDQQPQDVLVIERVERPTED